MRILIGGFWFADILSNLARELSRLEETHLFAPSHLRDAFGGQQSGNAHAEFLDTNPNPFWPPNYSLRKRVGEIVKRIDPDIVHLQFSGHLMWFVRSGVFEPPTIVTVHDVVPHHGQMPMSFVPAMASILHDADAFVVHGEGQRSHFLHQYGQEKRVFVTPLGDSLNTEEEKKWSPLQISGYHLPPEYFLFFGTIKKYKGLDYFLRAAQIILSRTPEAKFVIAGSGRLSRNQIKIISNCTSIVCINRRISEEEMPSLFSNAISIILPYVEASQSGIVFIAYSFSKPVVATNVGSIAETVINEKGGIIVDARNAQSLADAMMTLLDDRNLADRMGRYGNSLIRDRHSWKNIAKLTLDIYGEVIRQRDRCN